jgi:PhzF family phenazine biosynthesis protein
MGQDIWIIDAFTDKPFLGNAAAVCLMESFPTTAQMQLIAAQMNLSETAFAVATIPLHYDLRWFTPEVEVNLCGHATLAATHMLVKSGLAAIGDTVTYHTMSGELKARVLGKNIELNFPTLPGEAVKAPAALRALGVEILACELSRDNYLVEVRDFETLLACKPNFKKLAKADAQGVIVTTATGVPGFDFASRYFGPAVGINEDPVTGSAHCTLAPYWAPKLGKTVFRALQASKGHGILDVTLQGSRTLIAGQCVTTLKGPLPTPYFKEKAAC